MIRSTSYIALAALFLIPTGCGSDAPRPAANANRAANSTASANASAQAANASLTREVFEKDKERFAKEARDLGRKIGNGPDDLWLWAKARVAVPADPDLGDASITIDVEKNVVTLNGSVSTMMRKLRAESIVRGIDGVKDVMNLLKVGPKAETSNSNS